jgi:hypothetical protein
MLRVCYISGDADGRGVRGRFRKPKIVPDEAIPLIQEVMELQFGWLNRVICGSPACQHFCKMIDNPEKYSVNGDNGEPGPPGQIGDF